jgi:hypothetical protein
MSVSDSDTRQAGRLRRVGALWKPRPGGKSKGSGAITINGLRQRFVILPNSRKQKESDPDYVLMSSDEPEVDQYARDRRQPRPTAAPAEDEPW